MDAPSNLAHRIFLSAALSISACLLLAAPLLAQTTTTGAIEGQVVDNQGNGIPGVVVQFINQETQVALSAKTDDQGNFSKSQLQPGLYTIVVRLPLGFQFEDTRPRITRVVLTEKRETLPPIRLQREMAAAAPTPAPGAGTPETPTPPRPAEDAVAKTDPKTNPAVVPGNVVGEEDVNIRSEINRTDGRRGGGYTDDEVSTLPLGGSTRTRTFDELALFLPGVTPPPQTSGDIAGPGIGAGVGSAGQFSVNGMRSRGNNFTMDGSDNNDEDIGVRRQGFLALVPQPVESIKEYRVTTLLAPAQYGRNFGAQVDAVSKSGGNETHGTFYGFLNTSQLNSRNFFDTTNGNAVTQLRAGNNQPVLLDGRPLNVSNESGGEDSFTLGQGGFVLGGPLMPQVGEKPKSLFYFVSAEGHILNATKEANFAVPTVEERGVGGSGASGLFFNPITGSRNPIDFYFPTSLQGDAIFSLFPFPNNPTGVYGRNTLTQVLPASGQSKIASGKFDANFEAFGVAHQLTGRYNFTDDYRDIPVTGGAVFSSLRPNVRTQNFSTIFTTQVTSTMSNEFRASYGRTKLSFEELRHPSLLPSDKLPGTPFLLNAPYRINNTMPLCPNPNSGCVANTGPVLYETGFDLTRNRPATAERGLNNPTRRDFDEGALGPLGQVIIAGYSPLGVDVFNFPQNRVNNTYQIADTLAVRAGGHSLAFGTDIRRAELNSDLPRLSRTLLTFNGAPRLRYDGSFRNFTAANFRFDGFFSPVDLAAAQAASGTFQTLAAPGSSSSVGLRYYQLYFFGQDEWRIRPNLSLSFGLRYEYTTPAREVNNVIERTFNSPDIARLLPNLRRFIDGRSEIFDPDRNNFAPRLGFAYSPRPSTIIRAGYGWYYDQIIGAVVSQSRNTFPSFLTLNAGGGLSNGVGDIAGFPILNIFNIASPNSGICQLDVNGDCLPGTFRSYTAPGTLNVLNPSLGTSPVDITVNVNNNEFPSPFGVTLPARDLSAPMAQHYSLTVEQQVGSNLVVSVAYVGTQGRHLLRATTPNLGPNNILLPVEFNENSSVPEFYGISLSPGTNVDRNSNLIPAVSGTPIGRPVSGVGAVNIFETSANSRYDALQVQVRGRYARGLQYQANYTFSKSEDDVSDVFDLAGASSLPQNSRTRTGERADSNFDARHRVAYNLNYAFGNYSNRRSFARFLLDGLEVASTGQFQTGQPFTINSIFDVNLDGNLTDRLNSTNGIIRTGDRQRPVMLGAGVNPTSLLATVGQDGSVPRNSFRASNLMLFNVAVIKNFRITEDQAFTFRTEIFNLTDRDNFGIPIRFLEAPGFGRATETVTPGRRIQFALKYSF